MLGVRSYAELLDKKSDMRAVISEFVQLKLIFLGKCAKCRINRVLTRSTNFKDDFAGRCPKCRKFYPLSKNKGFFVETQLKLRDLLQILYCWAQGLSQKHCAQLTRLSLPSVNQWYRYARDIASWKLIQHEEEFVFGGPSVIVQIDESVIAKRKYNRGKRVVLRWVLGIYDTSKKKGLVIHVEKRNEATLIPIIKKHVKPGTEIWTDQWAAYNSLSKKGYIHKTVNHSEYFKDPVSGVCTNQVEGFWAVLKKELRKKCVNNSTMISEHIDEYMWRKTYLTSERVNALDTILQHISEKYT